MYVNDSVMGGDAAETCALWLRIKICKANGGTYSERASSLGPCVSVHTFPEVPPP